jgi:hypothetical protein
MFVPSPLPFPRFIINDPKLQWIEACQNKKGLWSSGQ